MNHAAPLVARFGPKRSWSGKWMAGDVPWASLAAACPRSDSLSDGRVATVWPGFRFRQLRVPVRQWRVPVLAPGLGPIGSDRQRVMKLFRAAEKLCCDSAKLLRETRPCPRVLFLYDYKCSGQADASCQVYHRGESHAREFSHPRLQSVQ